MLAELEAGQKKPKGKEKKKSGREGKDDLLAEIGKRSPSERRGRFPLELSHGSGSRRRNDGAAKVIVD